MMATNRCNLLDMPVELALYSTVAHTAHAGTPHGSLLQESPLAGFRCHSGEAVWSRLRENDALRVYASSEQTTSRMCR